MNEAVLILLILAFVVLVGVGLYIQWRMEQKRTQALHGVSQILGWEFFPEHDTRHDDEYHHFEVFRRGHDRSAYNTMLGTVELAGREFSAKAGDFKYTVTSGSGKNRSSTTYRFSYLILHLPWYCPDLLIRPEGMFDKIAGVFGLADINFESAEFSRKFHVTSPDKKFAYDVITPRMMEFLLESAHATIDIEHGRCSLTDGKRRWQPHEFRQALDFLTYFFSQWPEHVTASLDEGSR